MKLYFLKIIIILFGISILFTAPLNAISTANVIGKTINAGLVSGIWYSKLPFFAGNKIKVFTAIFNNMPFTIAGKVQFFDYNTLIGESDFLAKTNDVFNVSIDWLINEGNHIISTKLINTVKIEAGKESEPIFLSLALSPKSENFADFDTDEDGIGNMDDFDDDNDGVSDEEETKQRTDPLNNDTDEYEILNGTDKASLKKEEKISPTPPLINVVTEEKGIKKYIPDNFFGFLKTSENKIAGLLPKKIDEILKQQVKKIENKKQEIKKEINQAKEEKKGDKKEKEITELKKQEVIKVIQNKIIKILKYVYFILLTIGFFILKHKIIFYILIFTCLFLVFKWIFGKSTSE